MIYSYGLSLQGLSHSEKGVVCQDAHRISILDNGWVIAAVADGVGSSMNSDVASRIAVDSIIDFVQQNMPGEWNEESMKSLLRIGFHNAQRAIELEALEKDRPLMDYDTTLTALIYDGRKVVFGHVGDSGIIGLSSFGDYIPLTRAQKGDAYNEVVPLRAGAEKWVFDESEEEFSGLLMFTDGILDIALPSLLNGEVYVRFAREFLDYTHFTVDPDLDELEQEIKAFLESEDCTPITDDKTVVAIMNVDIPPVPKDENYYSEPDWKALREELYKKLYPNLQPATSAEEPVKTSSDL